MNKRTAKPVAFKNLSDIPESSVSMSDTLVFKTGSWRYVQPIYENKTPPCNEACPAGVNIQGFMHLVAQGKFQEAAIQYRFEHPLPAITGRTCYHPCEIACNRTELDDPLSINAVERRIGDEALKYRTINPNKGLRTEKIAVVGSGPSGLTCAFYLAMLGYGVTVYEKFAAAGGVLRYGIPDYRLPKSILDSEIENIAGVGVSFEFNREIGNNISIDELRKEFDAVYLATGVWRSKHLGVPGEDAAGVMSGLQFLVNVNTGEAPEIGPRVAIIGGGNTAMDACRTALRLGAEPTVIYRRTRAEMPAIEEEIREAEAESIPFEFLTAPLEVLTEDGKVTALRCLRMKLGEPDDSGRRRPVPIEGSEFEIPIDTILTAIGEEANLDFLDDKLEIKWKKLVSGPMGVTSDEKIFAGGDVIDQPHTVVEAIGAGKKASVAIDAMLHERSSEEIFEGIRIGEKNSISTASYMKLSQEHSKKVVRFDDINTDYFAKSGRVEAIHLEPDKRGASFDEVNKGLSDEEAIKEAARCFNCATCNECDNCILFCPDIAVLRTPEEEQAEGRPPYLIDYEYCKGCLLCVQECPRGAMSVEEVVR